MNNDTMRKVYRKLTKEQKDRGIIFSSELVKTPEQERGDEHEVYEAKNPEEEKENEEKVARLKDDKMFRDGYFNYNIIRQ